MKTYTVYFVIKANRTEYLADVAVKAQTAKEACKAARVWYYDMSGKNAFRPTAKMDAADRKWYENRGNLRHFQTVVDAQAELAKLPA
ncbi:MAG: hypothetical protein LUG17_03270 [Clostridiales bacterium]|nr:hypothetical protein [Clostridiales bacterium]